jgi:hypothetical protein
MGHEAPRRACPRIPVGSSPHAHATHTRHTRPRKHTEVEDTRVGAPSRGESPATRVRNGAPGKATEGRGNHAVALSRPHPPPFRPPGSPAAVPRTVVARRPPPRSASSHSRCLVRVRGRTIRQRRPFLRALTCTRRLCVSRAHHCGGTHTRARVPSRTPTRGERGSGRGARASFEETQEAT